MNTEFKKATLSIKLEFRPIEIMIDYEKGAIESFFRIIKDEFSM